MVGAMGTPPPTSEGSTLESVEGRRTEPAARASERRGDVAPTLLELGAWYYDPRNSHPTPVRLIVLEGGRVLVSGPGVDIECAACELRIAAPVLGDTLDSVLLPSGAKCEMYAKDEIDRLRQLGGRPVPFGRIYRWEQSWALSLMAVVCVIGILIAGYQWAIPFGAARVARASPALAQRIGRGTLTLLDMTFEPSGLAPKEQRRIRALFEGVTRDYPGLPLKLELRQAHLANAFALSDGTVVLTDELVRLSEHDDMLVGIMFHEAGHVAHGHGLRRAIESSTLAVVAMAYYGEADQVTALAGSLPIAYAQSRYSRGEETEADDAALAGLLRNGKDPRRYAELLRALTRELGAERTELSYFSSHPATPERIQRFESAQSAAAMRPQR
jgi:Zn-dependent protease with chaperone function